MCHTSFGSPSCPAQAFDVAGLLAAAEPAAGKHHSLLNPGLASSSLHTSGSNPHSIAVYILPLSFVFVGHCKCCLFSWDESLLLFPEHFVILHFRFHPAFIYIYIYLLPTPLHLWHHAFRECYKVKILWVTLESWLSEVLQCKCTFNQTVCIFQDMPYGGVVRYTIVWTTLFSSLILKKRIQKTMEINQFAIYKMEKNRMIYYWSSMSHREKQFGRI